MQPIPFSSSLSSARRGWLNLSSSWKANQKWKILSRGQTIRTSKPIIHVVLKIFRQVLPVNTVEHAPQLQHCIQSCLKRSFILGLSHRAKLCSQHFPQLEHAFLKCIKHVLQLRHNLIIFVCPAKSIWYYVFVYSKLNNKHLLNKAFAVPKTPFMTAISFEPILDISSGSKVGHFSGKSCRPANLTVSDTWTKCSHKHIGILQGYNCLLVFGFSVVQHTSNSRYSFWSSRGQHGISHFLAHLPVENWTRQKKHHNQSAPCPNIF